VTQPVLVLQHGEDVPPGVLAEVIEARRVPHVIVRLDCGARVPGLGGWAGIVSLGGEMGAYDTDEYPYLVGEKALLGAATESGVPVLGICLGAQLLADATGGVAYRAPHVEASVLVFGSALSKADPVVGQLDAPQLTFHRDTFDLPPRACRIEESDAYPQAYRIERSIGVQTHPEITPEIARSWLEAPEGQVMLEEAGVEGHILLEALEQDPDTARDAAHRFFGAWFDEVYTV
jgi:GMP synthase (glutamine-hydrolysing)